MGGKVKQSVHLPLFVLNDCNSGSTIPTSTYQQQQHHHPENAAPLPHHVQPHQFHEETSASLQLLLLPRQIHLEHMNHMRIKIPIRKNWKLWNKLELSMVLLMLQNSCKMLRLSSILNSSAASHVTLAMQGFMMFGCVCLCDFSLSWN